MKDNQLIFDYIYDKEFNSENNTQVVFDYITNKIDTDIYSIFKYELNVPVEYLNSLNILPEINQERYKEVLIDNLLCAVKTNKESTLFVYDLASYIKLINFDYLKKPLNDFLKQKDVRYSEKILYTYVSNTDDIDKKINFIKKYNEIANNYNIKLNYYLFKRDFSEQLFEYLYKNINVSTTFFKELFIDILYTDSDISFFEKEYLPYNFLKNTFQLTDKDMFYIKNKMFHVSHIKENNKKKLNNLMKSISKRKNLTKENKLVLMNNLNKILEI